MIDQFKTKHLKKIDPKVHLNTCLGGFTRVGILPELVGCQLDDIVISLCYSLGATYLRVSNGEVTTDSVPGRVTIIVDENDIIENISIEISFSPTPGLDVSCGADMSSRIKKLKKKNSIE